MGLRNKPSRRSDKRFFSKGNRTNGKNFAHANVNRGGFWL